MNKPIHFVFLMSLCLLPFGLKSQKKIMDENVYSEWNKISSIEISNTGEWVHYTQKAETKDPELKIYNTRKNSTYSYLRCANAQFSEDGQYLCFSRSLGIDSLRSLKRQKTKEEDFPIDTLCIFNLDRQHIFKIANTSSFDLPKKWNGYIIYQNVIRDSIQKSSEDSKTLIVHELATRREDTLCFVKEYVLAEESPKLIYSVQDADSTALEGIYHFDLRTRTKTQIHSGIFETKKLATDRLGEQVAALINQDTSDLQTKPRECLYWRLNQQNSTIIARSSDRFMPEDWIISPDSDLYFSKNGGRLFYGIRSKPIVQDTSLLEDEIVHVEVWTSDDELLYTQQNARKEAIEKQWVPVVFNTLNHTIHILGGTDCPHVLFDKDHKSSYALGYDDRFYQKYIQWLGYGYKDLFRINLNSGKRELIAKKVQGNPQISPFGKYAYWYNAEDSLWMTYSFEKNALQKITNNKISPFYDELNDRPMHPYSYGIASWTMDDSYIIINDRYDLWRIDPKGQEEPKRLTKGRENKTTYRYIALDEEHNYIDSSSPMLLHLFDEKDKSEGYALYNLTSDNIELIFKEDFQFAKRLTKAKSTNDLIFTKESFDVFPNLIHTPDFFETQMTISDANPQQKEYRWGDVKLHHWMSYDSIEHSGLLVTPEDFDPNKKYPLLVNFYERSSNRLHHHRAPYAHRSTINYTYYTNRGYVIFNPDVIYKNGYPGRSCYNSVMSGIQSVVNLGFIDKERIGVQGHSWGGYQIAHLLTKTNVFACAEAGAPVVNMTSAYGGIRWRTGMSRMFQYERTQSRIGGTLWDSTHLYLENSPLFETPKVETPVLILHNDGDGAVPWHQGIEYFVALRRLGKKAWLLNYKDEPHWPVLWQNRLDFNIRMQQFFDHYLMDAPMPTWMKEGISVDKAGIDKGY